MTIKRAGNEAEIVLNEIETRAQRNFWPIIGAIKGRYLANTVRKYQVKKVLEIGTLVGYSAILIASNLPDDGKVFTIEINPQSAETAEVNIRRANLDDKVHILVGNALDLIPGISEELDMAFIDAAKDEYLRYLKLCEEKLKTGGVVFADNVKIFAIQMKDYLSYVRQSGKYKSQYYDTGFDGVEVSIKLF